ncbi:hypothetical protein VP01_1074g1 [Puccinia sorghi]|uniref:Uncharacterized protein n=1 Tax=Puccinia sorghi TaxID=27349 RepID=A0A0L6VTU3_9BASI|nr:hypothetical protein VP01_1074g1 [Puccinia sorghi]
MDVLLLFKPSCRSQLYTSLNQHCKYSGKKHYSCPLWTGAKLRTTTQGLKSKHFQSINKNTPQLKLQSFTFGLLKKNTQFFLRERNPVLTKYTSCAYLFLNLILSLFFQERFFTMGMWGCFGSLYLGCLCEASFNEQQPQWKQIFSISIFLLSICLVPSFPSIKVEVFHLYHHMLRFPVNLILSLSSSDFMPCSLHIKRRFSILPCSSQYLSHLRSLISPVLKIINLEVINILDFRERTLFVTFFSLIEPFKSRLLFRFNRKVLQINQSIINCYPQIFTLPASSQFSQVNIIITISSKKYFYISDDWIQRKCEYSITRRVEESPLRFLQLSSISCLSFPINQILIIPSVKYLTLLFFMTCSSSYKEVNIKNNIFELKSKYYLILSKIESKPNLFSRH